MKNKFFINKLLPIISFVLLISFCFFSTSFGFSEEVQEEVNFVVNKLVENSKDNGVTYPIDMSSSSTRVSFWETDFEYNGSQCKYLVLMYWNSQYTVTFTDGIVLAQNNESSRHEICQYYFDKNYSLIGAVSSNLAYYGTIEFNGVKSYFQSDFVVKNSAGEVIEPFFQVSPLILAMKVEKKEKTITTTLVGLVGLLIPLLICLVGFWKAWQFLLRILRTS